jgi:hypothetical protein
VIDGLVEGYSGSWLEIEEFLEEVFGLETDVLPVLAL